jgi:hypothetical protein
MQIAAVVGASAVVADGGIMQFRYKEPGPWPRWGTIPLPIFPAKCSNLVAGKTWDALVLQPTSPHHPSGTSKQND